MDSNNLTQTSNQAQTVVTNHLLADKPGHLTIESLLTYLEAYLDSSQIHEVKLAYHFAQSAHEGQKRQSGEDYICHPIAVAVILADMHMDHQCLMAALLHDVIEDTGISKSILAKQFGEDVTNLVDGVSKLKNMSQSHAEAQAENFQKMTLAMAKDIRVILVKTADRLHNMRTLGFLNNEKRRRIAKETLEIYAPIANRLGMNKVHIELEELGFRALHPLRSKMIKKAVKKARNNRKELASKILTSIESCLASENIEVKVSGREKHLYSIYSKMRSKHKSFREIMDVSTFRIIVDNIDTCYRALGAVHGLYKPVAGKFKDYIAIPKGNGYQSLHTTLFGTHGLPIEIQIRTEEMEMIASHGIAGHWLYKSNATSSTGSHERTKEWMKGLLEIQQSAGNALEFIENAKMALFPDEVYVFTPTGQIYTLTQGATPIDFAYAIHTDIGNTCVSCRINRRFAPLSAILESGQTVEIITSPGTQASPAWLSFVITGKARSSIRHALKHQQRSESIELGRRLLDRIFKSKNRSLEQIKPERLAQFLKEKKFAHLDDLLAAIGLGNQMAYVIAQALLSDNMQEDSQGTLSKQQTNIPLAIMGTEGIVVNYAKCCRPIPGDPIIGHISTGKGIVIHIESCRNMHEFRGKPEEIMTVRWDENVSQEYSVELRIEHEHEKGMIAELANTVTNVDANIERMHRVEKDAALSVIHLVMTVRDRVHLAKAIRQLRKIHSVAHIIRSKG